MANLSTEERVTQLSTPTSGILKTSDSLTLVVLPETADRSFQEIPSNQEEPETTWSITVCDDDFDGITTFTFEDVLSQLQEEFQDSGIQEDLVYIANSYNGLIKIENVSTNPNRVFVCGSSRTLYEVAVDQNKDVYVSSRDGLFLVDVETCNYQRLGSLPAGSNLAMSFDTQNNLYVGGFHSSVYRADSGQFDDYYEWHDFGTGSSGGDFVVIGEFMYIAWAVNNDYYLYKVTLDEDNQYVSHVNLGNIITDTFGLAAENGQLYGVTPDYLYSIDLPSLNTERIIQNSSSTPWWGAAGLHEAISFNFTFHLSNEDALIGINPLDSTFSNTIPNYQQIYIRIFNETTGEIEVIALDLNVISPPETTEANLYECADGNSPGVFNLTEAISSMLEDSTSVDISYYTSQENANNQNNPIQNPASYQAQGDNQVIYVRFAMGDCASFNTITLQTDAQTLDLGNDISICEGQSVTLSPNGSFDSYTWSGLVGEDANNNDINSSEITITQPGTYSLTVSYGTNCTITEQINVTQEALPVFANQTLSFCSEGQSLEITTTQLISALNEMNPEFTYTLYNSTVDAENNTDALSGSIQVNHNQNLIIQVKNNTNSSCYTLNELNIQLNPIPSFEWQENYSICEGDSQVIAVSDDFTTYQWSGLKDQDLQYNDVNSNQVTVTMAGTYILEVTHENCSITKEVTVSFEDQAIIEEVDIQGNAATIVASGNPPLQYSFDGVTWSNNPTIADLENGEFTAYVRGENVCGITELSFALFSFSNVITPNNDGYNDYWEVKGLQSYPGSTVKIYNRYGKLLLDETIIGDFKWYGTYKGTKLSSGSYWYVLEVIDGRNYSGHITIKNFQ